jgi:hypothetical protein
VTIIFRRRTLPLGVSQLQFSNSGLPIFSSPKWIRHLFLYSYFCMEKYTNGVVCPYATVSVCVYVSPVATEIHKGIEFSISHINHIKIRSGILREMRKVSFPYSEFKFCWVPGGCLEFVRLRLR